MDDALETFEKRKERIKEWLNKNVLFVGILLIALFLRLYYFILTKTQAHWWDSLAYGSMAKNSIMHLWADTSFLAHEIIIRPPLLPFLWSILIRLGSPETLSLFLLEIIPSFVAIIFIYLFARELYNKKIALISCFLLSILWIHLFYSVRMMTDAPSLMFLLISLYFFAKSYKRIELRPFTLAIFFLSLATLTRFPSGLVGFVYLCFLFLTQKLSFLKKKSFWIGGFLGSIPLAIFFIRNMFVSGKWFPSIAVYVGGAGQEASYAFFVIYQLIPHILKNVLLVFFVFGLLIVLFQLVLGLGFFSQMKKLRSNLLLVLLFIFSLIFFIFLLKFAEDRYLFVCLPALIIFMAIAISYISDTLKRYGKFLPIIFILVVLIIATYQQITFADFLIKEKIGSYIQLKEAFLWINQNTPENSVLFGGGIDPYSIYYAERKYLIWEENNLTEEFPFQEVDYVILHGFEHQDQEFVNYVNENPSRFSPIHATFFDKENQQPAVIIYQVK